jgi:hypothetical protein
MTGPRISNEDQGRRPHFIIDGFSSVQAFRPLGGGDQRSIPPQNRASHGNTLLQQLAAIRRPAELARESRESSDVDIEESLLLEFVGFPGLELAFESLARERSGIELLNVRQDGETIYATVFVPQRKLAHFEKLIGDYLGERRGSRNQALDNRPLIDTIKEIRAASVRALWTDDPVVFPLVEDQTFWWEVWLPIRGNREAAVQTFRTMAEAQGIRVAVGEVRFLERTVLLAFASLAQMARSVAMLSLIAEFRRAKETAEFFDSLPPQEQQEWLQDLLVRVVIPAPGENVPHVCLLDTGVNAGHALIAPALDGADLHSVEPNWGTHDVDGHGTEMAGVALLGDITRVLGQPELIVVPHRLESVKILRYDDDNEGDPEHHGYLTVEAVARPEITASTRSRVFGLAVTSRDNRDRGRPSAWSSAIDSLSSDTDGEGANPRLIVVSAGNIDDPNAWVHYPHSNSTDGIHDPGQAWNALTVGAYTDLIRITEPGAENQQPVASAGGLSPFSTTSSTWQTQWPLKPDVVLEGGNVSRDAVGAASSSSLSLLTTCHLPHERSFSTIRATSAATALATRMAADIMATYPTLRPESVRGLIVHSAEWTEEMLRLYLPRDREPNKGDFANLVRHCGFGVPNIERAKWSASNSLSLLVEDRLNPFKREGSATPKLRDMQLHNLPWPKEQLEGLGEIIIEMRVTLSYFIEPNPSARGRSRYRYESHGLRFDVKRPGESVRDFQARINRAARDEEEGIRTTSDDRNWKIGPQNRHRGSLHSDIWTGPAVELASRGVIAVYPASGWWKTRT